MNISAKNIEDIKKFVIELLENRKYDSFEQEYNRILREYLKFLKQDTLLPVEKDSYQVKEYVTKDVSKINTYIRKIIKLYLKGNILESYQKFNDFWEMFNTTMVSPHALDLKIDPQNHSDQYWYRIRKGINQVDSIRDMFHVPINYRGKLSNYRYSVSGYPCLYLGKSIYTCWEEVRRPNLSDFAVNAFKLVKPINVLDLRLSRPISGREETEYYLKFLPFILACSIRVKNDENTFKEEYILPQLLLHSVINNKTTEYDGIIYTSSRRDSEIIDTLALSENLVLPIKDFSSKTGYCTKLASSFNACMPISFINIMIKEPQFLIKSNNNWSSHYNNCIYGKMENLLKGKNFKKILD